MPDAVNAARAPVAIVGAGPVGVTAAILLAQRGIRSVLLERHRDIYPLPRAVAMDDEVRRILQAVGIHEEFAAISRPANGLRLFDDKHRVLATFRRGDPHGHHGFPQTSLFDQPELERLLRQALARHDECVLRGGVEVTDVRPQPDGGPAPVRLTLRAGDSGETEYLWADYVLGCDGANSIVREAIGSTWEDLHFEERWMVLDVRTRLPVRCWEGADQVCDPARTGTFMRVGEDRYRWEFRLGDDERGELLAPGRIRELIRPWVRIENEVDLEVIRQTEYTFRARIADRWRRDRVFLLGDAAHQTPPFIGQGLCTGMRDAYNLSWKLARVLDDGADERLLESYEAERKPHAKYLIRLAVAMGWAMTGGQDRAAVIRRALLGTVFRIPVVTKVFSDNISPALHRGPLVRRSKLAGRRLVGSICPQPWVSHGGRRTRLDDVLGDGFALLTSTTPSPETIAVAQAFGARVVHLHGAEDGSGDGQATRIADDGTLAAWLRRGRARTVLLRPDRVVLDAVPRGGRLRVDAAWGLLLHPDGSRDASARRTRIPTPASTMRSTD